MSEVNTWVNRNNPILNDLANQPDLSKEETSAKLISEIRSANQDKNKTENTIKTLKDFILSKEGQEIEPILDLLKAYVDKIDNQDEEEFQFFRERFYQYWNEAATVVGQDWFNIREKYKALKYFEKQNKKLFNTFGELKLQPIVNISKKYNPLFISCYAYVLGWDEIPLFKRSGKQEYEFLFFATPEDSKNLEILGAIIPNFNWLDRILQEDRGKLKNLIDKLVNTIKNVNIRFIIPDGYNYVVDGVEHKSPKEQLNTVERQKLRKMNQLLQRQKSKFTKNQDSTEPVEQKPSTGPKIITMQAQQNIVQQADEQAPKKKRIIIKKK